MKKIAFYFMSMILLVGCGRNTVTIEEFPQRINAYEKNLQLLLDEYNLELGERSIWGIEGYSRDVEWRIKASDSEVITIGVGISYDKTGEGIEDFDVSYLKNNDKSVMNTELFVELVNVLSEREITLEQCEEFLKAPEDDYKGSEYGLKKSSEEEVEKYYPLNFMEEWKFYYVLKSDGQEELKFGGTAKKHTIE